ncbi:MAG: hypothetical protein EP330_16575 [Deltaproteobacteria bacterium]|nr:MAG: hypothetical protein EP330_16575 [Deltaproteobacteria bacterium]
MAEATPAVTPDASIEETTVGDLDGARVAVGTVVTSGKYTLPDGTEAKGVAAVLALPDDSSVWVGAGSVIAVDGTTWTVLEVKKQPGENGEVLLKRQ